jgi:hypothetical protein
MILAFTSLGAEGQVFTCIEQNDITVMWAAIESLGPIRSEPQNLPEHILHVSHRRTQNTIFGYSLAAINGTPAKSPIHFLL